MKKIFLIAGIFLSLTGFSQDVNLKVSLVARYTTLDTIKVFTNASYNDFPDNGDILDTMYLKNGLPDPDTTYHNDTLKRKESISISRYGLLFSAEQRAKLDDGQILQFILLNLKQKEYKLIFQPENMNNISGFIYDSYLDSNIVLPVFTTYRTYVFTINSDPRSYSTGRFRGMFAPCHVLDLDESNRVNHTRVKAKDAFKIYPNPTVNNTTKIKLMNTELGVYNIRIVDLSGKVISTKSITHRTKDAEYSLNLRKGEYFVQIISPNGFKYTQLLNSY